jgi:hypothetical protein
MLAENAIEVICRGRVFFVFMDNVDTWHAD